MEPISFEKTYQSSLGVKIRNRLRWIPEASYLLAFFLYITGQFIQGTMMAKLIPGTITYHIQMLAAFMVIAKALLFDRHSVKDWSIIFLLGTVLWASGNNAVLLEIFYYYIFIISAQDVDFSKIAKVFFITISSALLVTFVLAKFRIIHGLAYSRPNGAMRYALGTIYPSDLAARCFCLMLAYVIIKNFKLCFPEYLGMMAATLTTYVVTDTKVDFILMTLLILVSIFYKQTVSILKLLTSRGIAVILGTAVMAIILSTYFYTPGNPVFSMIDRALSGRLHYSHMAFNNYNVTSLGQYIVQHGFGGGTKAVLNYFYIDCSYIRVLMMFGCITFIIMVIFLLYLSYNFMNKQVYALEVALIFIALSALIDQHMWELSFNIIFLATFADLDNFRNNGHSLFFSR